MPRERVEDLGRIHALLDQIHIDFQDFLFPCRNKDCIDFFRAFPEEKQDEILHQMIYGISNIQDKLYDIQSIAAGNDRLNEPLI